MSVQFMTSHGSFDASHTSLSHSAHAKHLFDSGLFSDCTIRSQHRTWHLHRAILSQRCEFFQACFLHSFKESSIDPQEGILLVSMHDDNPVAVGRMLRWLYTLEYPVLEGVSLDCNDKVAFDMDRSIEADLERNHQTRSAIGLSSEPRKLPADFYRSEIALFAIADKYNLPDLAAQASSSICNAELLSPSFPGSTNSHQQSYADFIHVDDFISMLEILYLDLSNTSTNVKQCRQNIIQVSAGMIATLSKTNTGLQDLLASSTDFIVDMIESLQGTIVGLSSGSSRSPISSTRSTRSQDRSGSITSSDDSSTRSCGEHAGSPEKVYIPMNEDSDEED